MPGPGFIKLCLICLSSGWPQTFKRAASVTLDIYLTDFHVMKPLFPWLILPLNPHVPYNSFSFALQRAEASISLSNIITTGLLGDPIQCESLQV